MSLYQTLIESVKNRNCPIAQIVVGAHWTLVTSQYTGLASTQVIKFRPNHGVKNAGDLQRKRSDELLEYFFSENPVEAAVGLATINSLLSPPSLPHSGQNALEIITKYGERKTVAIIGHFPFVEQLRPQIKELRVFELDPLPGDHHADRLPKLLPECDVIGITSTTLLNKTLTQVLSYCQKDAIKILIGPSTPLTPLMFDYGIDFLCGVTIREREHLAKQISQGATLKQLSGIEYITISKKRMS